jgi:S-formylglutathione hydrolase FrmB
MVGKQKSNKIIMMKKDVYRNLLSIIALCLTIFLNAQTVSHSGHYNQGKVLEGLSMRSQLGNRNINYSIYLPPDYDVSSRSYPVVYLLHGYSDNETAWVQFGEVNITADRAIANRDIPPMIIVMPDAGVSFYINAYDSSNPFEDIMIKEFIPHIDKTFRTRANREYRAVAGLSMGGYGSLILSLRNPDIFSSCAAFSSAVFTDNEILEMPQERYDPFFKKLFGSDAENRRLTPYWREHSIIDLVNTLPMEQLRRTRFYIDNGDEDFLFEGNAMLHIAMRKRGVPHQFRVRDGAHNWTYWRTHIIEGLKFIGDGFHR